MPGDRLDVGPVGHDNVICTLAKHSPIFLVKSLQQIGLLHVVPSRHRNYTHGYASADVSQFVAYANVPYEFTLPEDTSNRIKVVIEGPLAGPCNYEAYGSQPGGGFLATENTMLAKKYGYIQLSPIYSVHTYNFVNEGTRITGDCEMNWVHFKAQTTREIGHDKSKIIPKTKTVTGWPKIYFGYYAYIGYGSLPYGARLRIYDMGDES
jgi:hypothetical protein